MKLKDLIENVMEILLGGLLFIFALVIFFELSINNQSGAFSFIGSVAEEGSSTPVETESNKKLTEIQNTTSPEVFYSGAACTAGETVQLKGLFRVKIPGAAAPVNGLDETGFKLEVEEIRDTHGNSYAKEMDSSLSDYSDEVMTVNYNAQTGEICFHKSGVYQVFMRVYGKNGRVSSVAVKIPVEVGG